ncbi:MAG: DUF1254 domain-containing protein [Roseobacter sp.]|uniref:DUF1254 domain-containing protein n=1 Tax=Tateyamaria sp. TaxID=1929288 RepID=UPI0032832151
MSGYVLDNPGSVNDGNEGHSYLLASPSWDGDVPDGIERVIQGESSILGTLTRTQVINGPDDMARVQDIQKSHALQQLSAFAGAAVLTDAETIDWPEWTDGDELSENFFEYMSFLLPFTPDNPDDAEMYEKLAKMGIVRGQRWDAASLDSASLAAKNASIANAQNHMKEISEALFDPAFFCDTREKIGTDHINRAGGGYVGIFGDTTDQSVYLTEVNDQTDASKNDYTVTFEAGNMPPVKYF